MMSCDFFLLENFFQRKNWFFILTCFIVIFRSNWRMSLELIVFWIHCTGNLFRDRLLHLSALASADWMARPAVVVTKTVFNGDRIIAYVSRRCGNLISTYCGATRKPRSGSKKCFPATGNWDTWQPQYKNIWTWTLLVCKKYKIFWANGRQYHGP